MALVDEAAADGSGAGIQIFVAAPDSEIRVIVMQSERHVADGVREVESDDATNEVSRTRDAWEIKRLSGAELHPGPQE